ncbi:hypothetical protein BCR32DRAFT_279342 [Anaeromyces robustus]|uniref:Uncharacterized protein n=1 Tax=Anaeromyces robustus TaxID=1754192 RepID=A0A1Y1X870_9FUNG|nr:hypothetical protein BCR32DRAFT_279342 [Anaeromyces robustus]|eukprot:ORX81947.1 hypothetical protein BCR32DRAFT_279342 [Anaeromyces robustus]
MNVYLSDDSYYSNESDSQTENSKFERLINFDDSSSIKPKALILTRRNTLNLGQNNIFDPYGFIICDYYIFFSLLYSWIENWTFFEAIILLFCQSLYYCVRKGCPLSSILFNLFINDILNNCENLGIIIGDKHCCGVFKKCTTMVIKPMSFTEPPNYLEPTFYLNMYIIPKVTCYTYLGILFSNDLSLEPIIDKIHNSFLLAYKKKILQSYVISKPLYYVPILSLKTFRYLLSQEFVLLDRINRFSSWAVKSSALMDRLKNESVSIKLIRLCCGYVYDLKIAFKSEKVSKECPSYCPCYQQGHQSFEHWIVYCPFFSLIRWNSLDFINDLFITFTDKIKRDTLYIIITPQP